VSGSAGLEGRSGNRLEDGLAPLDAECRHDGGSEGALRGRGQSVAHEGGAERGSHGDYGVVRAESGEVVVVVVEVLCFTVQCSMLVQGETRAKADLGTTEERLGASSVKS
jgi:hypothetical protein